MIDIETVKSQLTEVDKYIEITKKTRDDAIKARTEAATKVDMSMNELKELGITPENADKAVKALEDEIETLLLQVKSDIPMDLLKELKRIP